MIKTANVVGGGIGGVAAAACLAKLGISVSLYEKADELREIGAGIFLKTNSLRVFKWLGCLEELVGHGTWILGGELWDRRAKSVATRVMPPEQVIVVPRAALHATLVKVARREGVDLRTSADVTGVTEGGGLVLNGSPEPAADLLVGADGVGSIVRDSLNLCSFISPTGNGSWRALVSAGPKDPQNLVIEFWRGHRRLLVTPAGAGNTYICASCRNDDGAATTDRFDARVWAEHFPEFADVMHRVDPETTTRREHVAVRVNSWSRGPVAILGDAVHGQPPNLGQGAGCTIANAASLAKHIEQASDLFSALTQWEADERILTEEIQSFSTKYDDVVHRWPLILEPARTLVVTALANFRPTGRHWGRLSAGVRAS